MPNGNSRRRGLTPGVPLCEPWFEFFPPKTYVRWINPTVSVSLQLYSSTKGRGRVWISVADAHEPLLIIEHAFALADQRRLADSGNDISAWSLGRESPAIGFIAGFRHQLEVQRIGR